MKNTISIPTEVDIPDSVDGIMDVVREAVIKDGFQSLSITAGKSIVARHIPIDKEYIDKVIEGDKKDLSPYDIVIRTEIEEFAPETWSIPNNPQLVLFWAIYYLEHKKHTPVHIVMSESTGFWKWIGLKKKKRLLGLTVVEDKSMPDFAFIITGARDRGAALAEIMFGLKVNIVEAL